MWKESLRIGIGLIDGQHKVLFENIGELLKEIREAGKDHKQSYISTVTFLKDYAAKHFAAEEEYQFSINYSGYAGHKALHEKFLAGVLNFEKKMEESGFADAVVKEFTGMLLAWLLYHVADADQLIGKEAKKTEIIRNHGEMVVKSVGDVLFKLAGFDKAMTRAAAEHGESFAESLAVEVGITGGASGFITYVYPHSFVKNLVFEIMNFVPETIDELEVSTLFELSNILSGTICGELSREKKIICDIEPPFMTQRLAMRPDEAIAVETGKGIIEVDLAVSYR